MGIDTHKVCKCGSYASEYTMSTGIRTCRDCGSVLSINGVFQKSSPCFEMTDEEIDKYMGVKRKLYTLADVQAKREKAASAHDQRKAGFDLAADRIGIDKLAHETHCAIVEAGLAPAYPDDYYGTEIVLDGWHEIKIERRKPNVL